MTLYEELGISPNASAGEIRRAYRNLARLLHPDQQGNETLRRLAEGQMKRLNSVHATLADPVRRREYDAMTALTGVPRPRARSPVREVAWFMTGLIVATLYWRLLPAVPPTPQGGREAPTQAGGVPTARPRAPALKQPAEASAVAAQARPEPGEVRMELTRLPEPSFPSEPSALSPPVLAVTLAAPAVLQPAPVEPPPVPLPAAPRFGGTWIYVPPRVATSEKALYPAEYIETVILEDSGGIRGKYRARYRVPDRPISPEVVFRFAGKPEADSAGLTWNGAGGSAGEVKLVLLSPHTMRVDWIASSLGTQLGLASGTAVLTRRQEP